MILSNATKGIEINFYLPLMSFESLAARRQELWNEYETPTVPETKDDTWAEVCECYTRGSALCGMVIVGAQGEPFSLTNSWDPQPPPGVEEPSLF